MSIVNNSTFGSPTYPLWLDADYVKTNIGSVVLSSPQTLTGSSIIQIGTITVPAGTTWVTLNGWIDLQNSASFSTTISFYLGKTSTFDSSKASKLTGVGISASGDNYSVLDNLSYYNSAGLTTLGIYALNETGTSVTLTPKNAYGQNTYTSLPSVSGWTMSNTSGIISYFAGL